MKVLEEFYSPIVNGLRNLRLKTYYILRHKRTSKPKLDNRSKTQRARLQLLPLGLCEPRNHSSWQSVFGLISWDVPSMAVYLITVAMGWSSLNTGWILKHTNLQCHKSSPHKSISNEKVGKLNSFQEPISLWCYSEDEQLKHDSSFCGYKSWIQLIQSASDYNQYPRHSEKDKSGQNTRLYWESLTNICLSLCWLKNCKPLQDIGCCIKKRENTSTKVWVFVRS